MPTHVYANNNEIASKASEGKSIAAFPDVCFSPPAPPVGPMPLPYPNTGECTNTDKGTSKVFIKDKMSGMEGDSNFSKSMGDESATKNFTKGMITSALQGKCYFGLWSMDVQMEGKGVPRHLDMVTHNHASQAGNDPGGVNAAEQATPVEGSKNEKANIKFDYSVNFFNTESNGNIIRENSTDYSEQIKDLVKNDNFVNYTFIGSEKQFVNINIKNNSADSLYSDCLFNPKISSARVGRYVYGIIILNCIQGEDKTFAVKIKGVNPSGAKYVEDTVSGQFEITIPIGSLVQVFKFDCGCISGNRFRIECKNDKQTKLSPGIIETWHHAALYVKKCDTISDDEVRRFVALFHNKFKDSYFSFSIIFSGRKITEMQKDINLNYKSEYDCVKQEVFGQVQSSEDEKELFFSAVPYVIKMGFFRLLLVKNTAEFDKTILYNKKINHVNTNSKMSFNVNIPLLYNNILFNNPIESVSVNGESCLGNNKGNVISFDKEIEYPSKLIINTSELLKYNANNSGAFKYSIDIKYKYAYTSFGGLKDSSSNVVVSLYEFVGTQMKTRNFETVNQIIAHEIGHILGLAKESSKYSYTSNGIHCACPNENKPETDKDDKSKYTTPPQCIMFGAINSSEESGTFYFCNECARILRESDFSTGWKVVE